MALSSQCHSTLIRLEFDHFDLNPSVLPSFEELSIKSFPKLEKLMFCRRDETCPKWFSQFTYPSLIKLRTTSYMRLEFLETSPKLSEIDTEVWEFSESESEDEFSDPIGVGDHDDDE